MEKKKIFVLDSVFGRDIYQGIKWEAEDLGMNIDIEGYEIKRKIPIPPGKDIYFLHLTDIDLKEVEKLKRSQTKSYFVGLTRGDFKGNLKLFDEVITIFRYDEIEEIFKKALSKSS